MKHIQPQLAFARDNGIEIKVGNPKDQIPGVNIILPEHPSMIQAVDLDLNKIRKSVVKNAVQNNDVASVTKQDIEFLVAETGMDEQFVRDTLKALEIKF